MNAKLERTTTEIDKTKAKIAELQEKLRELEQQKVELENEEIVALFRKEKLNKNDLTAFIRSKKDDAESVKTKLEEGKGESPDALS